MNSKVSMKLVRQLQDSLSICGNAHPSWSRVLLENCKFLLPFESRRQYFYSSALGMARAFNYLYSQQIPENNQDFSAGRIQRQKVRVSREHILNSAIRTLDLYGKTRAILEIEFFGEIGTGLGPTLEFYTIVSHQLQRKDLGMWYSEKTYAIPSENSSGVTANANGNSHELNKPEEDLKVIDSLTDSGRRAIDLRPSDERSENPYEYVFNSGGLFPVPLRDSDLRSDEILKLFQFFGKLVAKALLDDRLLDISLAEAFFKWLVGGNLNMEDILQIYPDIGKTLFEFSEISRKFSEIKKSSGNDEKIISQARENLLYQGCPLEEICLYFVSPVHADWELKENGAEILVSLENLSEYIDLVVNHLLLDGVRLQMHSFVEGFEEILPISSLSCFTPSELDTLLCGWDSVNEDYWEKQGNFIFFLPSFFNVFD